MNALLAEADVGYAGIQNPYSKILFGNAKIFRNYFK